MKSDRFIADAKSTTYAGPYLVVCEGLSDARFIAVLLDDNNIEGFQVCYPTKETGGGNGVDAIGEYLKAVFASSSKNKLRGLVVVSDNDVHPRKSFEGIQRALKTPGFVPPKTRASVQQAGISTMIVMIPSPHRKGTLEHLLLDAVLDAHPTLRKCIDRFCSCTGKAKTWSKNKQAKMRLQALIASHCKDDPCTSLSWVWNKKGNPIPRRSVHFTPIIDALKAFASEVS